MNRVWWSLCCGVMAMLVAGSAPATAQGSGTSSVSGAPSAARASSGPTREGATVGVRAPARQGAETGEAAPFQGTRSGNRQATTLMIVGAAALLLGAIIGGDPGTIIMVGGAVVGLVGLYQFLQ